MTKQKDLMRQKGYLAADEAAERIGCSTTTIYKLLDEGRLQGVSVGNGPRARRYVASTSLIDYVGLDAAKAMGLIQ